MSDRQQWLADIVGPGHPTIRVAASDTGSAMIGSLADVAGSSSLPLGLEPAELGTRLGEAVADLHALAVEQCPFRAASESTLRDLRQRSAFRSEANGADVFVSPMPEPYSRYTMAELIDLAETQLSLVEPDPDDACVVHGDLRPKNLSVLPATGGRPAKIFMTEFDRLGVGDRHWDLAVVHRHLPAVAGAEALFAFYDAYGREPNLVRLDAFVLVSLLVERVEQWSPAVNR